MEFKENDKPIFLQIADRVTDEILAGVYKPGERVPSVREYGVAVEVNPNTVVRSYDYLQENGVLSNKRGVGYFVAPDAPEVIKALRRKVFLEQTAPAFFAEMRLLGITLDDLKKQMEAPRA